MKKLIIMFLGILLVLPSIALTKDVHVKGYYRRDGTYVRPHIRSAPGSYERNNSSTFHRSSYSHPSVASGKLNIKKPSKNQIRETEKFSGNVVKVVDGDTIIILVEGNKTQKIRLYGIDCPEKRQAFGKKAKKFTSSLVAGKNVKIVPIVNDRYGRLVALVYVDGVCVNQKIIEAGYAWVYTRYCDQQPLCSNWLYLELNARCFHMGLWNNKYPQAPWNFRRNRRK